ncbi:OLC1v1010808C1 [Oldenlandia corymbosa var. corymbosa]|uniref:OLC1v1010808C1 n=1 Tax=Oldenlandia corymbosa var. corymbosa TaxID=529605 RepID=A0AAV1DST5_OLDCO|nr:OLC1v1010808C1 [Oldenlandia corymbosa var. corymbosa]
MDLDDLESAKVPTRPTRFAPKGSKLKPKTEPVSSSSSSTVDLSKKEDNLDCKPETLTSSSNAFVSKTELKVSDIVEDGVPIDIDAKRDGSELPKDEPMGMEVEEEEEKGEEEEKEGEDEVVREIDVYLNPSIDPNTKLFVLQYPLRPLWRPYELDDRCSEVRVNPKSADIEVDLAVDPSTNYDADTKVEITKQTLASSWKAPIVAGYAVGVLVGDRLHLNPVHAVVQLRPSMKHYEPDSSKRRSSHNEDEAVEEEMKSEKQTGTVKKQGKAPALLNMANEDTEENWIPLTYHGAKSDVSARYMRKMVERNESPLKFLMSRQDYLNTICPGTSNENKRSKSPSRRDLCSLPLEERLKTWLLKEPQIHRFAALKHLASGAPPEDILEVLQEHARLVLGLWVPKSRLVYGEDTGIDVLARDYVLSLFSKTPVVKNSQLPQAPKLNKTMKEVLSVLAIERTSLKDWKFRVSPDMEFVKLYPKIASEQGQRWEHTEKQTAEILFRDKNKSAFKSSSTSIATNNSTTSKNLIKPLSQSSNDQMALRKPMSEETRKALPKALQKLFQAQKVCSLQQIRMGLRQMAVSENSRPKGGSARELKAAAECVDAPIEELESIIKQVAINIHGVYVSKSSSDYPQYDDLRNVVIHLFLADRNAKLKKGVVKEAVKQKLDRDMTDNEFQKVIQELCVSQNSAWVLKSGDGKP